MLLGVFDIAYLLAWVASQGPLQLEHRPGDLVTKGGMALLVVDWRLMVDWPGGSGGVLVVGRLAAAEQTPTGSRGCCGVVGAACRAERHFGLFVFGIV